MFRLFKLTPPHGWAAVAWELAIVTAGVLLALGAQQFADGLKQRSDVRELVGALRSELADGRARWEHMRATDACTVQRIAALEKWNATAPANAKLYRAYRLFLWNQHSAAWELASKSEAAVAIPLKERLLYASLYDAIDNWRQFINEENENALALNGLLATADQPENRAQIAYRLYVARAYVRRRDFNYAYFFNRFDALHIVRDESQLIVTPNDHLLCEKVEGLN